LFFVQRLMKLQRYASLLVFSCLFLGCSLPPDPLRESPPASQKPGSPAEPALQSPANNSLPVQSGQLVEPTQQAGKQMPELDATTALPIESSSTEFSPPDILEPGSTEEAIVIQKDKAEPARRDLSQRLGISIEEVTVLSVIGQEFWPDAFYCRTTKGRIARDEPSPLISGETILLGARGGKYEYHTSGQMLIFCRKLRS
jgi:hypothetical protein